MLRRVTLSLAITTVLVVGGGALAYALWSVTQPLPEVELSTGNFELTANWVNEPDLTGMFPGDSAAGTATAKLLSETTWQYSVDHEAQGDLAEYVDVLWYPDAECAGEGLPMGETHPQTLDGGTTSEFCIEFTLDPDTPPEMQGESVHVDVTVTAEQVRP